MKKIFLFLLLVISFQLPVFSSVKAYDATDTDWKITDFNSNAQINSDQKVNVTEEITVDFGNLEKHGIYRYIPYKYFRNGNNYIVRIKILGITDDAGNKIPYEESRQSDNFFIKIGNANKIVTGVQKYKINYSLERVINHFSDHDEFYWNVTSNDWPVPIENTEIRIQWPEGAEITQDVCYVGAYGSAQEDCKINTEKNSAIFTSNNALNPGEGFTVASGIKTGLLNPYSFYTVVAWFLSDNWAYLIPFLVLGWLIYNYLKNGRDPGGKKTIVPEFAPPDSLRPAVLGTLYDEKVDTRDISAVIIDLAVRGYLKIKEIENKNILGIKSKDYQFVDTGKNQKDLVNYEKEIMDGVFEEGKTAKLSDLKNKFYTHVKNIQNDLYREVVDRKYFLKNPNNTRNVYLILGGAIIFLGFFVGPFLGLITNSVSFMVAFMLSGILIIIFSFSAPKRTDLGAETNRKIKGFRLYMYTAERYREQFNEKEKIFERYLPYAMVFGIVKEWAKKFEGMQIEQPDWYQGNGVFNAIIFANVMSSMQNDMNSALVSNPSSAGSGGSGFSGGGAGGGFGGGGGGSW